MLVHASTPRALGIWPKSIEVQLFKGNAGDLWVIGTDLDVPDEAARKEGRRHKNLTDGSEKPIGEWNRMEITCKGDTLRVKVNGDLVNEATNCTVTRGRDLPPVRRGADRVPQHRADAAEEVTPCSTRCPAQKLPALASPSDPA